MSGCIVVGVDGSRDADAALRWAGEEAWLRRDHLEAILAWTPNDCPREVLDRAYAPGPHTIEGTALELLRECVQRTEDPRRPVPVTERAVYADAVEALMSAGAGADMIVVGYRGTSRLRRYLLGSVSVACLHQATRPVVVVRADGRGGANDDSGRPVLVGVDGSAASLAALRWAAEQAALHAAPLRVVHAWQAAPLLHSGHRIARDREAFEQAAYAVLDECMAKGLAGGVDVNLDTRLALGGAAQSLLAAAADALLLVLGARGLGGIAGLLLGSAAYQCVHHARCPVAVIPDAIR
ncbi:universal stress protein [Candidatus Frankia alpina]|uniref:Universal stress protein n=1 Tax=Candidatus Frankia alpina TaxID=2699483 RepID=A0A4S5ERV3_9ACTN|nr:universal stress protein [Candidatus Frankia alpina]THJ74862.1 universal stress protein [Candidatus Frankia alpina]